MSTILKGADFIGETFHYWTVISDVGLVNHGKIKLNSVFCKCKCGTEKVLSISSLNTGRSKSCGCYAAELRKKRMTIHGLGRHPLYSVWFSMISRCEKPTDAHYGDYGGRGISVCKEWKDDFMNFYNWAILNGWEPGLENDREDNNGNYEPSNCRFVTRKVNCRNKRDNRIISYKGQTKTFVEWAEYFNLPRGLLKDRINKCKWPLEKAFTTPIKHRA